LYPSSKKKEIGATDYVPLAGGIDEHKQKQWAT